MNLLTIIIPIIAGIGLSIQSSVNGTFGKKVGTFESAFLTFFTGAIILTVVVNFFGHGNMLALREVPRWQLLCAIFGAIYLVLMVFAVPYIGVTAAVVSVIIGQLVTSMIIDHFGLFDSVVVHFNTKRAIGVVLMIASLYFVFKGGKKQEA